MTVSPASGAECPNGGSKFQAGSQTGAACNGVDGAPGPEGPPGAEGQPWTAGGTLPPGESLKGAWAVGAVPKGAEPAGLLSPLFSPISFQIPLAGDLPEGNVHFLKPGEGSTSTCPGTAADPAAAAGHLCVYATATFGDFLAFNIGKAGFTAPGASAEGAIVGAVGWKEGSNAYGTWAVTAPED